MPIEDVNAMMARARQGEYAIGYFESWNLESLQGVIDAAEQSASPVIVGFNGDFLSRPEREAEERIELYAALGRAAGDSAAVPCGLIFNECPDRQWVRRATLAGFNLVMPANPAMPRDEYARWVTEVVRFAHNHGAKVEAEVGELPHGSPGAGGAPTDPAEAERFVEATAVDLLAVSVGNVHVMIDGERDLDLARLEAIHRRVHTPLVLHGGSGIAPEALKQAIRLGVRKVNYGTYLKQRYLRAVRKALTCDESNPHELLGIGGPQDALVAGRLAVRDAVLERIVHLGCRDNEQRTTDN